MDRPVARVLPLLVPAHLDREFDYRVPPELDEVAVPGVRVRVRFAGRLVDGFVLERCDRSDHTGELSRIERVVSAQPVLGEQLHELVTAVAARYAGTRADVLRLAIPPRHARVESEPVVPVDPPGPVVIDETAWARYTHGGAFLTALRAGRGPRAAWQMLPDENWPTRLAEAAAVVAATGASAVLVVPDQRDLDRVHRACVARVGERHVAALSAELGPARRYRRWLAALRGTARIVVGTRSAAFAPVPRLGLVAIWDDGDDTYADPRSPYPHSREVLMLRVHQTGAAFVAGGHARTAEIQAVVDSGWVHDLLAPRATVRRHMPAVVAPGDSDLAVARDPMARSARLPAVAFAAARAALEAGTPVLVQVPRRGYVPSLACGACRDPARCRRCHGPLELPNGPADVARSPTCRWCGTVDAGYRCRACGSPRLRALVLGSGRTVEELGRAFPGVPVASSDSVEGVRDRFDRAPRVVVATVGAEPVVEGGYGAALLLDGWALLGRADLRAAEETLRRWMSAAALVAVTGKVVVVAEPSAAAVQALVRWDPVWHAAVQLAERSQVGFPPAVRLATVDGPESEVVGLLEDAGLPDDVETLGPVPLVDAGGAHGTEGEPDRLLVERTLLRVPRSGGAALARALIRARTARSARRSEAAVRIRIDPIDIG